MMNNPSSLAESIDPLPNLPSALIRVAIDDLYRAESHPAYVIDMTKWHEPRKSVFLRRNQCAVCLAGAVMAFSLDAPPTKTFSQPADTSATISKKLYALDFFRAGFLGDGLTILGISETPEGLPIWKITPYEDDKQQFKEDMLDLADMLEAWSL